jgi:coatomer subunit alpha
VCSHEIPCRAQAFSLINLEEQLKKAYASVTAGKFSDALRQFTALLHTLPLVVVETRKEVDDVKELITIAK